MYPLQTTDKFSNERKVLWHTLWPRQLAIIPRRRQNVFEKTHINIRSVELPFTDIYGSWKKIC